MRKPCDDVVLFTLCRVVFPQRSSAGVTDWDKMDTETSGPQARGTNASFLFSRDGQATQSEKSAIVSCVSWVVGAGNLQTAITWTMICGIARQGKGNVARS